MPQQSTDGGMPSSGRWDVEQRPPTRACSSRGQGRRDDGLPGNRGVRDAVYWSGIIGNGHFGIDKDSVTNGDLWPHFCGSWVERSIAYGIENAVKQQFAPDPTTVV
jgi:hypothetical protein